jgi:hypothetical protein
MSTDQEPTGLKARVAKAARGGEALVEFLTDLLHRGAAVRHEGPSRDHPLVHLNALKNILGDDPDHPPPLLLTAAAELVEPLSLRAGERETSAAWAQSEPGTPVFLMDLEEAVQENDREAMEREAARVYQAAQNPVVVLECLAELALQDIPRCGVFIFHLLRAYAFPSRPGNAWQYIRSALGELQKERLPDPHLRTEREPAALAATVLAQPDVRLWVDLAAVWRLWEADYLRRNAFQREISAWCATLPEREIVPPSKPVEVNWLVEYRRQKGNQFITRAEHLFRHYPEAGSDVWSRLTALEALRFFARRVTAEQLPFIAEHVQQILET